ncbi:MAG: hypothetical protein KatS3mg057_1030 [Herpetosiphonaceae bacterium]|nr:MAG: hypothetical protein KatS3mg057_1030 [Herpetosiphonaceae bacterium]
MDITDHTGQRLDGSGLLSYKARMDDPALARFVSADSIVPGVGALTLWSSDETAEAVWKQGGETQDGKPNAPKNPQELNRYNYVNYSLVRQVLEPGFGHSPRPMMSRMWHVQQVVAELLTF